MSVGIEIQITSLAKCLIYRPIVKVSKLVINKHAKIVIAYRILYRLRKHLVTILKW